MNYDKIKISNYNIRFIYVKGTNTIRAKTTIFSEGRSVQCDLTFFPPSSAAWRELPVEVRVEEVEEQTASIRLSLTAASECM